VSTYRRITEASSIVEECLNAVGSVQATGCIIKERIKAGSRILKPGRVANERIIP